MVTNSQKLLVILVSATCLLLIGCQGMMGTLGGERVCLNLNSVTTNPTEQTVRRIVKRLEKELQFQQVYYDSEELRLGSSVPNDLVSRTVLSNSKSYPRWDLVIIYFPDNFQLECIVTTSIPSDSSNVILAHRVTAELKEMFPGSAPRNCTPYRDFLGP